MNKKNKYNDEYWMNKAISLAKYSEYLNEVPIGAVLVLNYKLIGQGWNCPIKSKDPTAHAEILALRDGSKNIGNYRLLGSILYVTLEPCLMCASAIIHARISKLVFGAYCKKNHINSNLLNLFYRNANHKIIIHSSILEKKCSFLLKNFFKYCRIRNKFPNSFLL